MAVNLLDVMSEKLSSALKDPTLSTDDQKQVTKVVKILESYKLSVSSLMKNKGYIFENNSKVKTLPMNTNNGRKESWARKNYKQDMNSVQNKEESNWRTLKPDSTPKKSIFMRNNTYNQTQIKKNHGMEFEKLNNLN